MFGLLGVKVKTVVLAEKTRLSYIPTWIHKEFLSWVKRDAIMLNLMGGGLKRTKLTMLSYGEFGQLQSCSQW